MNDVVQDFLQYFGLDNFGSITTVGELLQSIVIVFVALIFVIVSVRIIFEMVKILTDWTRFR